MKIESMFLRDINRDIDGVIKVDFIDKIDKELEEYVVTKEIAKHLAKFYENYSKGIDGNTTKMGVWISGFFGSGKSHFLKILSYLLANKPVDGKNPVDYFENKIEDPILLADMKRISKVETESILFNIDARGENKSDPNAILNAFIKIFDEHRGLCNKIPGVANMERQLIKDEVYEDFKKEFNNIRGFEWEARRNAFYLDRKYVADTISKVLNIPVDDAKAYIDNSVERYSIDIETFAKEVREYVESKGDNFHIIFLVDEVGQYIGNNGNLMLNLQTITEKLSSECKGKAWVIVTSQEKIDAVCPNIKEDDFSKIQGRFDTKLSMSSMSVDEVIKKRILDKKEISKMLLSEIYRLESTTLKGIIDFEGARKDLTSYSDEKEFIETYPFVPYQFKVLQSVFEQVRKHGNAGKHLSEGERSMLSAFKEAAITYQDKEEGVLIPFDVFYESIVEFLNPSITRVVDRASNKNEALKYDDFNIRVLKLLFMLKYLNDEIPANLENITTLMIDNINVDKIKLREKVTKSLEKLKNQNLIQRSGEVYVFLTDDEQDVNREIAQMKVDENKISKELSDYIFKQIYDQKRFRFITNNKLKYDKDFNKKMDGIPVGNAIYEFGLSVLSPNSDSYFKSDDTLKMESYTNKECIIKLNGDQYINELTEAMRIELYIDKTNIDNLPTNKQKIIADKKDERRQRRNLALSKLEAAIVEGDFFINGEKVIVKGSTPVDKIKNGLNDICKYVYSNIDYIKVKVEDINGIINILKTDHIQGRLGEVEGYDNEVAEREVDDFIKLEEPVNQIRVKSLINRFTAQPFGWDPMDVSAIVAKLLVDEKIKCKFNGEYLTVDEARQTAEALTQSANVDRVIINKKVKIDERIINEVKNIVDELFGSVTDSRNEEEIAKDIKRHIDNKLESIKGSLNLYSNSKYPGKPMFEKGKKLLLESKDCRDNLSLFNWIKDNEMELLEWNQDVEQPITFFENQREIFDKGILISEKCETNKEYLTETMKVAESDLNKIINNSNPYKDIRKIPTLVAEIEDGFEQRLKEKIEEAVEYINKDYEYLKLRSDQYGVSHSTKDEVINSYDSFIEQVKEEKDIYKVDAKVTQSSRKREYLENLISKDIKTTEEKDKKLREQQISVETKGNEKSEEIKTMEKPKKVVEKVKISNLVAISSIKTEVEVDIYIRELEAKLKGILRTNKEIEIEK
ncbi:TPA: BREX system P-loop protein BrxC [Clostridium perfringens]|uniref:BREX system P-loop protein BrxC n=1 Tax=Clostridium perfringens TaxID=1502 RepID=UPI00115B5724|nr:BREX system P-loop protein BrxC [Clostridium perfringens]MDU2323613.1 BREX system P-loop protein BrxC [Clostridium perfringens]HAT4128290.1 BREX system P-loop protein BrxC [Clostridium perfringens]